MNNVFTFQQLKIQEKKIYREKPPSILHYSSTQFPLLPSPLNWKVVLLLSCVSLSFSVQIQIFLLIFLFLKHKRNIHNTQNFAFYHSVVPRGFFLIFLLQLAHCKFPHSFQGLQSIPLYRGSRMQLTNSLLVDIWIVSNFCQYKQCCIE